MKQLCLWLSALLTFVCGCNSQSGVPDAAGITAGASRSPSASAPSWTTFQDPVEHAFSLQVPAGWKITGGLYRFGPLDPRAMVDMVSPNGKTDIRFGDYHVPPYATLSVTMRQLGWREGRPYSPRNMAQQIIANYRPGWVFADLYGQGRFSSRCTRLNLKSMRKANPVHESGPHMTTTAGEVVYACDSPSGPQVAYVFAETQLTEMQGIGNWGVPWLYSFIAPTDQADEAMKTTLRALASLEVNPQWEYRQLQIDGQANQVIMQDFQRNMAAIHADYERRSAALESQSESWDRIIRGVDLTTDPVDGKQREVAMGTGGSHWINGVGDIITSPTQPGANFRKLNTVP